MVFSLLYYRYFVSERKYKCVDGQEVSSKEVMHSINESSYKVESLKCDGEILRNQMTEEQKGDILKELQIKIDSLERIQE